MDIKHSDKSRVCNILYAENNNWLCILPYYIEIGLYPFTLEREPNGKSCYSTSWMSNISLLVVVVHHHILRTACSTQSINVHLPSFSSQMPWVVHKHDDSQVMNLLNIQPMFVLAAPNPRARMLLPDVLSCCLAIRHQFWIRVTC